MSSFQKKFLLNFLVVSNKYVEVKKKIVESFDKLTQLFLGASSWNLL